jgi:GTP-binding protein LepA
MDHIRNFSIIAHIDHGKSTLADRLIQRCGGLSDREMEAQVLDSMDIERERGITIKAQTASLRYTARERQGLQPQPDRYARACGLQLRGEPVAVGLRGRAAGGGRQPGRGGADGGQLLHRAGPGRGRGAGAQQDGPAQADPDNAKAEIEDVIGIDATDAIPCSAKTGMGIDEILEAVIARMPPPKGNPDGPPRAMIIDSWFDNYVGVVMLVRVVDGVLRKGDRIRMMATNAAYPLEQLGVFTPKSEPREMN